MTAAKGVDVPIDAGRTWMPARFFGADPGPYACRQFVLPMRLRPGQYTVACCDAPPMNPTLVWLL